jgi:hypothetical protein
MTKRQLERLTVAKLRTRCRKAKLPTYRHKGRRLLKGDLVAQLAKHYRKATPAPERNKTAVQLQESALVVTLAEQLIARALVDLPCDPTYSRAMHRIIRGGKAVKDRMILQRKRLVAIKVLRDAAPDDAGRDFWANRYAAEMNVAGC